MKTVDLKSMLIAIQILSYDKATYQAEINFAYSEPNAKGNAKKWHRVDMDNIFITGRAIKRLEDSGNDASQIYVSRNNSKDAKANPFCLVRKHKLDEEGNSTVSFYLKCVEENGSYLKESTMPNGDKTYTRIWKKDKPDYLFLRYIDMYEKEKAYHDAKQAEAVS